MISSVLKATNGPGDHSTTNDLQLRPRLEHSFQTMSRAEATPVSRATGAGPNVLSTPHESRPTGTSYLRLSGLCATPPAGFRTSTIFLASSPSVERRLLPTS